MLNRRGLGGAIRNVPFLRRISFQLFQTQDWRRVHRCSLFSGCLFRPLWCRLEASALLVLVQTPFPGVSSARAQPLCILQGTLRLHIQAPAVGTPSPPCLKEPTPCGFRFSGVGASARPRFGPFLRSPGHRLQRPPFQYNTSLMGSPLKTAHTSLPHHPLRETTALGVEETGSLESKPRLSLARRSKEMLLPRPAPSLPLLSFPSPCLFFLLSPRP